MHKGFLCIVLHAHLPYIRHPEYDYFLEENWLYEAITESYIPLLDLFDRLVNDGIDFRLTLSISPTLIEMLNDNLLRERCIKYIDRLMELTEKEAYRTRRDINFRPVVDMYYKRFRRIRHLFEDVYKRNLISVFKAFQDEGKLEILASAATHAFLPNLSMYPKAVKAQIRTGSKYYQKNFNKNPEGMWLPECGYAPGFDYYIKESGMRFFFLDTHGIVYGTPLPRYGVYAPVSCPSTVVAFGRDVESSRQVWSSVCGYPGDFDYRDFYRDVGFDLDLDYIKPYINPDGIRTYTGLKYYRITGKTDNKEPYVIKRARNKAAEHAGNFIFNRELQINFLSDVFKAKKVKLKPIITATYDTELFGHWWFEGVDWLDFLLRGICTGRRNFRTITPPEYLSSQTFQIKNNSQIYKELQICHPSLSSWGHKGYNEVWLNESNDYVYRHLFKATERMIYLAEKFSNAKGVLRRALNQAAREILLSQHSDWTFIIRSKPAMEYAKKRFEEHMNRFNILYQKIISDNISERWLAQLEDKDGIFRDINYKVYR
ncbi:MAG: glycoside hydrolase [Nitrospirae bacterium RBG_13_39_12]|nr:MAG: glycoside hydrolase [Nitrospirae bacterium RBG_13_39_12]